jgi:SAM-dependent methyltransferase
VAGLNIGTPSDPAPGADPARHAYAGAGHRWAEDAILAYRPMAEHLMRRCPVSPLNRAVLDAGAGTGAVGAVLAAAGALVTSCDLEHDMLRGDQGDSGICSATVADITALPFRNDAFDMAVAGFVLNHLADPVTGLRELGRVTHTGGVVLASVFGAERAPAKAAIDAVLTARGWRVPAWYQAMQARAAAVATSDQLVRAAARAGLVEAVVECADIDVGLDDPALIVRYRFGMPQVSVFVDALTASAQSAVIAEAIEAVERTAMSFRPSVVELVARVS